MNEFEDLDELDRIEAATNIIDDIVSEYERGLLPFTNAHDQLIAFGLTKSEVMTLLLDENEIKEGQE